MRRPMTFVCAVAAAIVFAIDLVTPRRRVVAPVVAAGAVDQRPPGR